MIKFINTLSGNVLTITLVTGTRADAATALTSSTLSFKHSQTGSNTSGIIRDFKSWKDEFLIKQNDSAH